MQWLPTVVALSGVWAANAGLHVSSFMPYPGYQGNLSVTGMAMVGQSGANGTNLWFMLAGIDPRCNGTSNGMNNSCGVHIHSGTTCTDSTSVAGHFYAGDTDPWLSTTYTANNISSKKTGQVVAAGTNITNNTGRVFVVHDSTGTKIACAVLQAQGDGLVASTFSTYPGYMGGLMVGGMVTISLSGDNLLLSYTLSGVDPLCVNSIDGVTNACGVHIHNGTTCDAAGGHYYDSSLPGDPWLTVMYKTDGSARAANVIVATGKTQDDNTGRALVVHDYNGTRVACMTLVADAAQVGMMKSASISMYPGYVGSLTTTGTVSIDQVDPMSNPGTPAQVLTYNLSGVDSTCTANAVLSSANACGIHIHVGPCTNTSTVQGHYYQVGSDPWTNVTYTVSSGQTSRGISVQVSTGATNQDISNRSVVVHDAAGTRIGCGNIGLQAATTTMQATISVNGLQRSLTTFAAALVALICLGFHE